jgi:hypothetical protein
MKGIATDIKARFDADLIPFNYNYQQIETIYKKHQSAFSNMTKSCG